MFCTGYFFGYEQSFKKGFEASFSVGLSGVSFNFYDQSFNSVYNDRSFITIPIVIRKYVNNANTRKSGFYYGIGVSGNWCLQDRKTIKNFQFTNKTTVEKFTGFNLSLHIETGYRIIQTKKTTLSLALSPQIDLITKYPNALNKIKFLKNVFMVSYSINLRKEK